MQDGPRPARISCNRQVGMLHDLKLNDEAGRLAALERSELLDTPHEPAFDAVVNLLKTIFDVPVAVVSLIDDRRQWYKASAGLDIAELPRELSPCNRTIQMPDALVIENAVTDARFCDHPLVTGPFGMRAYLGVPLTTADGYNIGTICVIDRKPRTFSAADRAILSQFQTLVLASIELRQRALTDGLTGVWTRRTFVEVMQKKIAQAHRSGEGAALLLFDLDHFKTVNDRYGHGVGDAVLRTVVGACEPVLRKGEAIGRLGGEEFAILLAPDCDADAMQAAERFRKAVEASSCPEKPELAVTASFGAAMLDNAIQTVEQWINAADAALYRAKSAGRNNCQLAD